MYNLKTVFAILSFEENIIKVLVVDKKGKKNNFLYYNSIEVKYDCALENVINLYELRNAIKEITLKTDKYLGFSIKRYIVNIPLLECEKHKLSSLEFEVIGNICFNETKNKLIDKLSWINEEVNNKIILFSDIHKWYLDNKEFDSFPLNKWGKKIKYEYTNYLCNYTSFNFIKNALENQGFSILAITNNQMLFNNFLCYVTINDEESIIYFNNKLIKHKSGFNSIQESVSIIVENKIDLKNLLDSLKLISHSDTSVPLVNFYTEKYKCFKQLDSFSLLKIIQKKYDILLNDIDQEILKNDINVEKVHIFGNDSISKIHLMNINFNIERFTFFHSKASNNIWLKEKNIESMLECLEFVYQKQKEYNENMIYSIDNLSTNSNIIEQALIKNAINKLGIFTTNWVAKLG